MVRDFVIRRLWAFVRRHRGDVAVAALLLAGLIVGGASALAGLRNFALALAPGMPAQASAESAREGPNGTRLSLSAVPTPPHRAPQILFPVQAHAFPSWLSAKSADEKARRPVIAICIDDLGEDIAGTDRAMALPKAVALSFLPYADMTPALAAEAGGKGHEILAHVPMEAVGAADPGPMALRVGASDIAARLMWNLDRVPGLVGFNNHEGSKFTADAASVRAVAQAASSRSLFFFDSRTGADSKVVPIARAFGIASAGRDVFLDDAPDEAAIRAQLARLLAVARRQGVAIAIGHPRDATLRTLVAWLAQEHGVTLVPLSEAIRLKSARETLVASR